LPEAKPKPLKKLLSYADLMTMEQKWVIDPEVESAPEPVKKPPDVASVASHLHVASHGPVPVERPSSLDIQDSQRGLDSQELDIQDSQPHLDSLDIQDSQSTSKPLPRQAPSRVNNDGLYVRLPPKLLKVMRFWCLDNQVDIRVFMARAIAAELRRLDIHTDLDIQDSHDIQNRRIDDDVDDDDRETLDIYERLTGNTASVADWACFREHRKYGNACVRLAIFRGRERKRGERISSFRYFTKIILEIAALPPATIAHEVGNEMVLFKRKYGRAGK